MITYELFCCNCQRVEARIAEACLRCGRDSEAVKLLPVTKNHPREALEYALRYGFDAIGENRVQEAMEKHLDCATLDIHWELIGHLQSNKVAKAVDIFDRIQSVDSEKLARKLNTTAEEYGRCLPILLQVNAGEDPQKFGVSCEAVPALLEQVMILSNLRVDGLMTIAPLDGDADSARRCFERLRQTRDFLAERFGLPLAELSMGMSDDLEAAVAAGSTQIRVGTALFGERL